MICTAIGTAKIFRVGMSQRIDFPGRTTYHCHSAQPPSSEPVEEMSSNLEELSSDSFPL